MPNGNIICEVLGYKYRHFSDTKTPSSLYIITALLLQSKIISLDEIYSWVMTRIYLAKLTINLTCVIFFQFQLSPTDKSIQIDWETDLDEAKEYVRKLNIISTNKEKEPEPEVEKDEIDVNTFFGILFLTAIICIKMLRIQSYLCSIALYNSRNYFYHLES